MPAETLSAYRDHGNPKKTLDEDLASANQVLNDLASIGIDLDQITQQLEDEGVEKFSAALHRLMASLEEKQTAMSTSSSRR